MIAIIIVNIFASFGIIAYILYINFKDKIEIVRELTKAFLAKNMEEYTETIPEYTEDIIQEEDELEDIGNIDETLLIKQLNNEHANIKDKD